VSPNLRMPIFRWTHISGQRKAVNEKQYIATYFRENDHSSISMATSNSTRFSIISGPTNPPLLEWTFNNVLEERCRTHRHHTALICTHQRIKYTFAQLQSRTRCLASALHGLGIGRGDRVALLLGNRAEYVEAWPSKEDRCLPGRC